MHMMQLVKYQAKSKLWPTMSPPPTSAILTRSCSDWSRGVSRLPGEKLQA